MGKKSSFSMQGSLEKKWDLSYLYDMAQQALEAGDIDQAIKLSKKGLEESELHANDEWIAKFRDISQALTEQYSNKPFDNEDAKDKKLYEDLTQIKGVGPTHEQKLWNAGYNTIRKVAESSPKTIARIRGIGIETARKFILSAREYLGITDVDEDLKTKQSSLGIQPESSTSIEEKGTEKPKQKSTPWFEDKFKINRLTQSVPRPVESETEVIEQQSEEDILEESSYQEFLKEKTPLIEEDSEEDKIVPLSESLIENKGEKKKTKKKQFKDIAKQILQRTELLNSKTKVPIQEEPVIEFVDKEGASVTSRMIKKATSLGYFSVPLERMRDQFQEIDIIIFKTISFKQNQQLILISPIKFAPIDDVLVISEDSVHYQNQGENNLMINAFTSNLMDAQLQIAENIASTGVLLEHIQRFLMIPMNVSKGYYENDNISLHSSGMHYLVHVNPILISQSDVKFIEKSIPFAYQRNSNIHYIQESHLIPLLQFLENKHRFVEEHNTAQKVEDSQDQANQKFQKQLLRYSLIPCGFGGLTIIMALAQIPSLLLPFIGLSYAVLCVYGVIVGYLFYTFKIKRRNLRSQYMVPSYQRPISLDEASLEIIYQGLVDELMLQFGYECFGKSSQYKLLNRIEQQRSEQVIMSPQLNSQENELEDLFEPEENEASSKKDTYHTKIDEFLAE